MYQRILKHSISLSVTGAVLLGILGTAVYAVAFLGTWALAEIPGYLVTGIIFGLLFLYPLILTGINLASLFTGFRNPEAVRKLRHFQWITLLLGSLYSLILLAFSDITTADWTQTLYNNQKHAPVWPDGMLTVAVLSCLGIAGYLFLSAVRITRISPLISVLAIASMYIGMLECALWIIQVFDPDLLNGRFYLCLFPLNCIFMGVRVIRLKVEEWRKGQEKESPEEIKGFRNRGLEWMNEKLTSSASWPAAAFLLMWPLLGILICILILFGQQPDHVIRAWTQTSDWRLSGQVSPQNLYYDEHYLCTVAAGGHRKVVKPLRMGLRHGHPVIVNRQLCVANAFEQILEERLPKTHRRIRDFYDTYGFPLAKRIRSPYAADAVYFLMKPLEWIFLAVIYAVDVRPENRIAVQYLPESICQKGFQNEKSGV